MLLDIEGHQSHFEIHDVTLRVSADKCINACTTHVTKRNIVALRYISIKLGTKPPLIALTNIYLVATRTSILKGKKKGFRKVTLVLSKIWIFLG